MSYVGKYFIPSCLIKLVVIYVKETFSEMIGFDSGFTGYAYRANYKNESMYTEQDYGEIYSDFSACVKWKPSIHIPKEAARIFLKETGVLVERLQDITTKQAIKEEMCSEISCCVLPAYTMFFTCSIMVLPKCFIHFFPAIKIHPIIVSFYNRR